VLGCVALAALGAPHLAPHDPLQTNGAAALAPPSARDWLGTDEFGRDVLSRLIYGARASMTVSLAATALALTLGTAGGLAAGYYGGAADVLIMRGCDVLIAIPPIVLAIAIIAIWGPSVVNLVLTIALLYSPGIARVAHASTRVVRRLEHVQAALALGARQGYVIRTAVLPAIATPLIVQGALTVSAAILVESGLSFLGLGVPPPTPTWGGMVSSARPVMDHDAWLVAWPSAALACVILSFNVLGDGLRDGLDPRWRSEHRRHGLVSGPARFRE
jgi:peptide/nickel transport system permease protein